MADKPLTQEQREALRNEAIRALGAGAAFTVSVPPGTVLPFSNYLSDTSKFNIKQKEAMRMFPQADPNLFDTKRHQAYWYQSGPPIIPTNQAEASSRVFNKEVRKWDFETHPLYPDQLYKGKSFFPTVLKSQPGAPSTELGSYAAAIGNQSIFPEGDIQAITVTPAPNPGRFAQDYAEVLADKLGKTLYEREAFLNAGHAASNPSPMFMRLLTDAIGADAVKKNFETLNRLDKKINVFSNKLPQTAGYIWGNINKPQYSYAEGNWALGQKEAGSNPAIYLSRINADPSKEAEYLYTSDINTVPKETRVNLKQYPESGWGKATGPSWGIASNKDISFRKDLIGARGELTVGDLQALLAERNLPFEYQSYTSPPERTFTTPGGIGVSVKAESVPQKKPGDILETNLKRLAKAEGITPSQVVERYARLVPNVGEPTIPPTAAVFGSQGKFPMEGGPVASPTGSFAAKTDLRQLGILPPADKTSYSPFAVDEFDAVFNHVYPRYGASSLKRITPSDSSNLGISNLIINRDKLRPLAANKLLDQTAKRLIEQGKPVRNLGLMGVATGALTTVMDPGVIDALSRGDYLGAGATGAINTAIGSAVGGGIGKGLQALQAAGYARPAAAIGGAVPVAGAVLTGLGAAETVKALDRAYERTTGKKWTERNQVRTSYPTYTGPTPEIKPRMATAILGGKEIQVPYGSLAGMKKVGRPWWDTLGSQLTNWVNVLGKDEPIRAYPIKR